MNMLVQMPDWVLSTADVGATAPKPKRSYPKRSPMPSEWLTNPAYTPRKLLNHVASHLKATSDCDLAGRLDYDHGALNRVSHKKAIISYMLLITILDHTGWSLAYVRELAGMPFIEGDR